MIKKVADEVAIKNEKNFIHKVLNVYLEHVFGSKIEVKDTTPSVYAVMRAEQRYFFLAKKSIHKSFIFSRNFLKIDIEGEQFNRREFVHVYFYPEVIGYFGFDKQTVIKIMNNVKNLIEQHKASMNWQYINYHH